jgi:hypothetical protein
MPCTLYLPVGGSGTTALSRRAVAAGVLPSDGLVSLGHFRRVLTGSAHDSGVDVVCDRLMGDIVAQRLSRRLHCWVTTTKGRGVPRWLAMADKYGAVLVVIGYVPSALPSDLHPPHRAVTAAAFDRTLDARFANGKVEVTAGG